MFDFIRAHNKLFFFVLVLLILPSFVFFGVQGYSRMDEGATAAVARVDGQKITQAEWDAAHRQQVDQIRRSIQGVDPKLLDSPEIKREALDRLMRERVLFTSAQKQHLYVTDEQLKQELLTIPALNQLRGPDGAINLEAYKAMLTAQGLTPESFEASVRQEAMLRQVVEGPANAVPASIAPARAALDALLQRRDVQIQAFDSKAYLAKVAPTAEDLQNHYKRQEAQFRTPEQAVIEYVVLDADALKGGAAVSADDVRKYYDENAARYTKAEERQASHILVKADKSAPADQRATAKAQAEKWLAEARKAPEQFAALAKQHSQDPGSAEQGGDLGFFGRNAMVKPFEDAVYAMKPGEISNVIETDFGFHVIKLVATRGGEKQAFEAVRASIEDDLKKQLAQKEYAKVADQFGNLAYEQSDTLQPLVDRLKLTKRSATVARAPMPGASGALASPKLLDAVFGQDVLKNKRNTEAIETGPNQLVAARVTEHQPARVRPFDEVKDRVREAVVADQAAALARKEGEARLAQVKASGDAAGFPAVVSVSRAQTQGQSQTMLNAIMAAPTTTLPHWLGVDLGQGGYAVVRVVAVKAPDPASPEVTALAPRYGQAWAAAQAAGYYDALKRRLKADVLVKAPMPGAAEASAAAPSGAGGAASAAPAR